MVADWDLACTAPFNLCLLGAGDKTNALMDELGPHLRHPVITLSSSSLELPAAGESVGTLMLSDFGGLRLADQHHLMGWLTQANVPPRVISTSQGSILPMISAGAFLAPLYYRLNTICLDVRQAEPLNLRCEIPQHHKQQTLPVL